VMLILVRNYAYWKDPRFSGILKQNTCWTPP
jgi:hypothetical protein